MEVSRVRTLILLLIALDLPECHAYGRQAQDDARKITIAVVRSKSATIKQTYKCRIDSQRHVHAESPVDGRLAAILVKEGQAVKRGDPLFQVEPPGDKEKPESETREKVVSIKAPCDGLVVGRLPTQPGSRVCMGESLATRGAGDMLVGDTHWVALPCDQGTSSGRVSELTETSTKIGSPTANRASDAGLDVSEVSELAKNENDHILLSGCSVFSFQCSVAECVCLRLGWQSMAFVFYSEWSPCRSWGGVQRVHAASWATNRTHRRLFAQLFWRTCRSFEVDGAEILDHVRRFSMPRASIAETCRIQGRRRRWIVARSNRTNGCGTKTMQANSQKPTVYTGVRMLEKFCGVPNSPTDRTVIGSDGSLRMSLENQ